MEHPQHDTHLAMDATPSATLDLPQGNCKVLSAIMANHTKRRSVHTFGSRGFGTSFAITPKGKIKPLAPQRTNKENAFGHREIATGMVTCENPTKTLAHPEPSHAAPAPTHTATPCETYAEHPEPSVLDSAFISDARGFRAPHRAPRGGPGGRHEGPVEGAFEDAVTYPGWAVTDGRTFEETVEGADHEDDGAEVQSRAPKGAPSAFAVPLSVAARMQGPLGGPFGARVRGPAVGTLVQLGGYMASPCRIKPDSLRPICEDEPLREAVSSENAPCSAACGSPADDGVFGRSIGFSDRQTDRSPPTKRYLPSTQRMPSVENAHVRGHAATTAGAGTPNAGIAQNAGNAHISRHGGTKLGVATASAGMVQHAAKALGATDAATGRESTPSAADVAAHGGMSANAVHGGVSDMRASGSAGMSDENAYSHLVQRMSCEWQLLAPPTRRIEGPDTCGGALGPRQGPSEGPFGGTGIGEGPGVNRAAGGASGGPAGPSSGPSVPVMRVRTLAGMGFRGDEDAEE